MDAATGMRGPRREVETVDRRLGAPQAGHRTPDQLLMDRGRPAVERAAEQVAVRLLEPEWPVDVASDHPVTEAGGKALDLGFEPVDDGLYFALVPLAGHAVGSGVGSHCLRHVRVAPGGFRAGR